MANGVYKLFMNYQGREVDDSFTNQAFEMMMEDEKSLGPHVKGLKIEEDEGKNIAEYNWGDKVIRIYKPNFIKYKNEVMPNKELQMLRVLKHEIEHARNYSRMLEQKQDIESTIIRYSLAGFPTGTELDKMDPREALEIMLRWGKKKENYTIDPEERLADIRAAQYLVNLLKSQNKTPELLMARKFLFYSLIRGYRDNGYYLDPPTYQFLLKMSMYHDYYLLKKRVEGMPDTFASEEEKVAPPREKYVFETRLTYGLPISQQEFAEEIPNRVKLLVRKK